MTWTWTGAGPVVGAGLFLKADADPATVAAAKALSDSLRGTALPADVQVWPGAKWEEFPGMLNGPPFQAKRSQIRLVIGSKPH
jgi:hypothetical protein